MAQPPKITVELPLLLCFFSFMLTGPIYTNLIVFRTCYVVLGYNKSECALLGNTANNITEHLEKLVEPEANIINMVRSVVESVFTSLMCIFIGPWSDRFGRKPVLLSCVSGFAMGSVLVSIFSYFENLSPWFLIVCAIPSMISGGFASFLTIVFSYIADISNDETRGMRMACIEGVFAAGSLLGNLLSSYLFYATSYISVFNIATVCYAISIVYIIYYLAETVENREREGRIKGFFEISNISHMVNTTIKVRENHNRAIILLTVVILTTFIFIVNGEGLMFLYLREKLQWTLTKYTLFSSASSVVWILGSVIGTYVLHKLLDVTESVLVLVGLLSMLDGALLTGLATNDWHIYAGAAVKCLGGTISPMLRSLVAKLVLPEEVGKIFSLIMASEFIFSLGASPLYTTVYNSTINTDPAVFNYLSAGFYLVDIVLIIIIMTMQYFSFSKYTTLNDETVNDSTHAIN